MILLPFHIIAGLLAIAAGGVALYAAKGSKLHRKSGMIFAIAMLVMTSSAMVMAVFFKPNRPNVVAGMLTFYLVCTGVLTVRRRVEEMRGLATGFMFFGLAAGMYAIALAFEGFNSANGRIDGLPPHPLFLFAAVGLLAGLGDARMLLARKIEGAQRIARHLWRMSFAMWIATASFFLGQSKFFPAPIRKSGLLAIPVVLVLIVMFYWLVRVRSKRRPTFVAQS
jgi:uncharacterized membrane protein